MEGLDPAELLHQLLFRTRRRFAAGRRARRTSEALVLLAAGLALGVGFVVAGAAADGGLRRIDAPG
jgi:hypothetical protein